MICHKCGFLNPDNTKICLSCGAKLITNINPKFGDLSEFDNNNLVTQLISKFEENFSNIFDELERLNKRTEKLESQIMELRSGLFTLVDLLSEKDLIKREKFSHIWENNILLHIAMEEERDKFLSLKDEILLMEENSKKEKLESTLNKVESYYNTGNSEKALEELEKASKKHKKNYKLHLFLGQIYYLKKDYSKSIEHLFKSFALQPEDYETNLYLGIALNEIGQPDKAQEFLLKAIDLNPNDYLPFFTLGTIYFFEENYKLAELFLTQAMEIEKRPETMFFLGLIYKAQNKKKKAEKFLKEVIEMEPDFEDAYYYLGLIYLELNWNNKAKKMFEKVLSLNPARFELNAFKTGKNYDFEGIQLNEEVKKITRKCEKLIEEGKDEHAIECYRQILDEMPENPEILLKLSTLYIEKGDTERGIETASILLNKNVNENTLLHAYNIIHTALLIDGKIKEAYEIMSKFLSKAKDNFSKSFVYTTLAFDLIDLNEIDKAIEYAKSGLKIAPRDLRHIALDALGWANYKKGRFKKALELLNESISIEPNNYSAIYHLGMTYLTLKKKSKAKKTFLKLLKLKDSENEIIPHIENE
ncbi:conserved hypothetical protein [Thermotomaculum hydrothermale]|uniref:Tetratricopeptide repeat protein n=1 Tax=Thermotomaculum hydrothermale TaxID=981385 RepID=A0A7R6SXQ1_9BACT|nr:tetratricopeptide repeat protein [Thermotomaculum hydrothermale]BBB32039.1 conserved hypothetical protein [Thermotomaculum hydrothermale]